MNLIIILGSILVTIFVSSGNWIDFDTAPKITMHFIDKHSRLPITIRFADLATHEGRKSYQN
ncbi:endonuclease V [Bacillus sp. JJ1521]|uniref:endonuclease V n=1 Tax=Bacillus sp. JJ1521 TaxID=3122957 RepID=UPI002FFD983E